jgi:hypothetical protein
MAVMIVVTGLARTLRKRAVAPVRGQIRRGGGHAGCAEQKAQQRRGGRHHQQRASGQQVTSASMLRPPSVGPVTEM